MIEYHRRAAWGGGRGPWWVCRWCGNPWRDDPAVVRQPVGRSLAMYRDHLRGCSSYRSRQVAS